MIILTILSSFQINNHQLSIVWMQAETGRFKFILARMFSKIVVINVNGNLFLSQIFILKIEIMDQITMLLFALLNKLPLLLQTKYETLLCTDQAWLST